MNLSETEIRAKNALAANPYPETPLVEIGADGIMIKTGYSEALHRLLRWVPHAKFRSDRRIWLIPFSGAEAVRAVLPEIIRLAEASEDLNAAEARQRDRKASYLERAPIENLIAAAKLLYGEDWQNPLIKNLDIAPELMTGILADPAKLAAGDKLFSKLVRLMRSRAAELISEAETLEEVCSTQHAKA